jgi:hypothetical protein
VTSSIAWIIAPRHDRSYRGSRSQFSYPKYNRRALAVQTNSTRGCFRGQKTWRVSSAETYRWSRQSWSSSSI